MKAQITIPFFASLEDIIQVETDLAGKPGVSGKKRLLCILRKHNEEIDEICRDWERIKEKQGDTYGQRDEAKRGKFPTIQGYS